jgi:hypothetical protein
MVLYASAYPNVAHLHIPRYHVACDFMLGRSLIIWVQANTFKRKCLELGTPGQHRKCECSIAETMWRRAESKVLDLGSQGRGNVPLVQLLGSWKHLKAADLCMKFG